MRSVENDMILQAILQSELRRIPQWLRITKVKLVIALLVEIAIVVMILFSLYPEVLSSISSFSGFKYWYCLLPLAAIAPLWFYKAYRRESMAYQSASLIASVKSAKKYNEIERDYGGYCDTPSSSPAGRFLNKPARYCPECGLLLVPGEIKCRSCVTSGHRQLTIPNRS